MTDIAIFKNSEQLQILEQSSRIVETLSNNYKAIIQGMTKSQATKNAYIRCVAPYLAFIQVNGFNTLSYQAYRNAIEKMEASTPTKNLYLSSAKALLKESIKYGVLPFDITANVEHFTAEKGHKKDGLKEDEIRKVLQYVEELKPEKQPKLKAMVMLLCCDGLRQFELTHLLVEDVSLKDKAISFKGKGRDDKEFFLMSSQTAKALESYLVTLPTGQRYVFENRQGEKLTERYIRKLFTCPTTGIFSRCGIDGRSVHSFRHFFATKTLEATNGNIGMTRRRTRHKTDATVQVYDDRRIKRTELEEIEKHFNF